MMTAELLNKQPRLWDGQEVKRTPEEKADLRKWWKQFEKELDESNRIEPLDDDFLKVCTGTMK
jgi:hypothetical protein